MICLAIIFASRPSAIDVP